MPKITMSELNRMLADVDVPDKDIAEFLTILPDESNPFQPRRRARPSEGRGADPLEEFQAEAAVATGLISFWARERRRHRFERRLANNTKPILYAEGESWLQSLPFGGSDRSTRQRSLDPLHEQTRRHVGEHGLPRAAQRISARAAPAPCRSQTAGPLHLYHLDAVRPTATCQRG